MLRVLDTNFFYFYSQFTSTRKTALFIKDLSSSIVNSLKTPISQSEAQEHIECLAETVPGYIHIVNVSGVVVVRKGEVADQGVGVVRERVKSLL